VGSPLRTLFRRLAFADAPRKGVPLEIFYLPLHENWPSPMEGNYNGDYWADRAFPDSYRRTFVEVSRQMAEHFRDRGWNDTLFQCFFNGKVNYKERGWSRGSCPWLLDEPSNFQTTGRCATSGPRSTRGRRAPAAGPNCLPLRHLSAAMAADALDGLLDYNVVSGAFRTYRRHVLDRKEAQGRWSSIRDRERHRASNVAAGRWSLDAWSLGPTGYCPGNDRQASVLETGRTCCPSSTPA